MKDRKNKNILTALLVSLLLILSIGNRVIADSGFDTSYDSGSSSSYDSGWSSSSSSSYDYDDDYHYSGSGGGSGSIGTLILVIIIIIVIVAISNSSGGNNGGSSGITPTDDGDDNASNVTAELSGVTIKKIKKLIPDFDLDSFKLQAFGIYKNLQKAWMDFDTDTIRDIVTDEMFNMYSMQLDTLRAKKQQNIMSSIKLHKFVITDIKEENNMVSITTNMSISMYDYIVNKETKQVLRGSSSTKVNNYYEMTFVRDKESGEKVEKCPSCGAPVNMNASGKCPYCGTTIVVKAKDFVLSKKENIRQS